MTTPAMPDDRHAKIRRAWRGCSCRLFSPAPWMSDDELEAIAARMRNCSVADIIRAVEVAEAAAALLDACAAAHEWSQSTGEQRSEFNFAFHVLPKLQTALKQAIGGNHDRTRQTNSSPHTGNLRALSQAHCGDARTGGPDCAAAGTNPNHIPGDHCRRLSAGGALECRSGTPAQASAPQIQTPRVNIRRLKIEADGDAWKNKIKPKIRLMGKWLEAAGFIPGTHVSVRCIASGLMELRCMTPGLMLNDNTESYKDSPQLAADPF